MIPAVSGRNPTEDAGREEVPESATTGRADCGADPAPASVTAPPAPAASPGPCSRCRDSGRLYVNVEPKGRPALWEPIPCPSCRPEASPLLPDGTLKDAAGRKAAVEARRRGA